MASNSSLADICFHLRDPDSILFTPQQENAIHVVLQFMNVISILAATWVIVTYILFKRQFPQSMPLYFAISAGFMHCFLLAGSISGPADLCESPAVCTVQGKICPVDEKSIRILLNVVTATGVQYFGAATMYWFLSIAVSLYLMVVKRQDVAQKRIEILTHALVWGAPLVQTIIPLAAGKFVSRYFWCWITDADNGMWEFALLYAQMGVVCITSTVLWFAVVVRMCRASRRMYQFGGRPSRPPTSLARHVVGVLLLGVVFIIMITHRIYNLVREKYEFAFLLTHTTTLSSVGLIVFISFGLSRDNLYRWKTIIRGPSELSYDYQKFESR